MRGRYCLVGGTEFRAAALIGVLGRRADTMRDRFATADDDRPLLEIAREAEHAATRLRVLLDRCGKAAG